MKTPPPIPDANTPSPLILVHPCNCVYVDGELKKACKQMREGGHE